VNYNRILLSQSGRDPVTKKCLDIGMVQINQLDVMESQNTSLKRNAYQLSVLLPFNLIFSFIGEHKNIVVCKSSTEGHWLRAKLTIIA